MEGFEQALAEYERHLFAPYDEGGALYYEEEAEKEAERFIDWM